MLNLIDRRDYAYSPFGTSTTLGPDDGNTIQFTGRENDQTGLYYYRARYYDPVLKRFVSEDPIGMTAGPNFYSYVHGNPVSYTDPHGLLVFGALAQAVRVISGQTAQEAAVGGRIADAIVGPAVEAGGRDALPPSIAQEYGGAIDTAQVAMSAQGIALSVQVAIGMASAGATVSGAIVGAGVSAVALPAIIAGVSGATAGAGVNRLWERYMGQPIGGSIYDLVENLRCR